VKVTSHLALLAIPGIEVQGRVTMEMQAEAMGRIDKFNAALPALAANSGGAFMALPPMASPHTIDGVHLNATGYSAWDETILKGISMICGVH